MLLTTESSVILRLADVISSVSADVPSASPSSPSLIPSAMLAVCPDPSALCKHNFQPHQYLTIQNSRQFCDTLHLCRQGNVLTGQLMLRSKPQDDMPSLWRY